MKGGTNSFTSIERKNVKSEMSAGKIRKRQKNCSRNYAFSWLGAWPESRYRGKQEVIDCKRKKKKKKKCIIVLKFIVCERVRLRQAGGFHWGKWIWDGARTKWGKTNKQEKHITADWQRANKVQSCAVRDEERAFRCVFVMTVNWITLCIIHRKTNIKLSEVILWKWNVNWAQMIW